MTAGFAKASDSGWAWVAAAVLLFTPLGAGPAHAQTPPPSTVLVRAVDENGAGIHGFRYQVEEDTTYPVPLGIPVNGTLGTSIHRTYAPPATSGHTDGAEVTVGLDPAKRYFVSVMPDTPVAPGAAKHNIGGAPVLGSSASVTVRCLTQPLKTAQIWVKVFDDNRSPNGAIDLPGEDGLGGFTVTINDPLGLVSQDAFGNPLGSTYSPAGELLSTGSGILKTDANGELLIQNLAPFRYAVFVTPPAGTPWLQTTTIDGLPGIDAWVKSGEPPYFTESGTVEWHVWFGFTKPQGLRRVVGPAGRIQGQVVFVHEQRPPLQPGLWPGEPVPQCLVALSDLSNQDEQVYMGPCDDDSRFDIQGVPPGQYLLTLWDKQLRAIMDFRTVTIPSNGGTVSLDQVPVYSWRGTLEGNVFYDADANGLKDAGEPGIGDQVVNIRWPDGSMYQSTVTDPTGRYALDTVFPWFNWLVFETDITRFNPVASSLVVDDGGQTDPGKPYHAQVQPDGLPYRVEEGMITEGISLYAGAHSTVNFGKQEYASGRNGGISGMVTYENTRAEDDPRMAVAEEWSPGIPRVRVAAYADADRNGRVDDLNGNGVADLTDVDNHPYGWQDGTGPMGPEDEKRSTEGDAGTFDAGDALQVVGTDSFDDSPPTGCVQSPQTPDGQFIHGSVLPDGTVTGLPENRVQDCAETLPTYNQMRPAVYSGAYAFFTIHPGGMFTGSEEIDMPQGTYIIEAIPPLNPDGTRSYEVQKEQDKNVLDGPEYTPNATFLYPPPCVGEPNVVPGWVGPFQDQPSNVPDVRDPVTGEMVRPQRPLCNLKQVPLYDRQNAAANFHFFSQVPKASFIWGLVFNDVLLEFDPTSPNAGTNFGVPWLPISVKDSAGAEIARTYTDEWGRYNALVPSSYAANVPTPTGFSPNVLTICLNDPGQFLDSQGRLVTDPWWNPIYQRVCTNWEFLPGMTTVTDTPILPVAAFQGNAIPPDCGYGDDTPLIYSVDGPTGPSGAPGARGTTGPWVPNPGPNARIRISAALDEEVPNPDYDPETAGSEPTVIRRHGFGATPGTVKVGSRSLPIVSWADDEVVARVPTTVGGQPVRDDQLLLTRGDNGRETPLGVFLTVGPDTVRRVSPCANQVQLPPPAGCSLQKAIDDAPNGALVLVAPGTYKENVILWKKLRIQGYGAHSTSIQAGPMNPDEVAAWDAKMAALEANGRVELIPGERPDFFLERGAGITVATRRGLFTSSNNARIDGLSIWLAERGGGIFVNAYARFLEISNNRLYSNQGSLGGGIRVGTPSVRNAAGGNGGPDNSDNPGGYAGSANTFLKVHHNAITANGALDGGGGIALFNGSDRYAVQQNLVCGNFSLLYGGGIAHFGRSPNGLIDGNRVVSNQAFDEGGGIMVAGELVPAGSPAGTLAPGSGSVQVSNNVVVANMAGDDGGGLRTLMVNGQDVVNRPKSRWYAVQVYNNRITNNSSADAGGGISLDDTLKATITHNTIANNDSTATSPDAFGGTCVPGMSGGGGPSCPGEAGGGLTTSQPQVAGVASRMTSNDLLKALPASLRNANAFSNPVFQNNVVWHNRSFHWDAAYNGTSDQTAFGGLRPDIAAGEAPVYWDLGVTGQTSPGQVLRINARNSLLTSVAGYATSNRTGDPLFVDPYVNQYKATSRGSALGNFVSITFTPTGLVHDYHIRTGSGALGIGAPGALSSAPGVLKRDLDGETRPYAGAPDAGADELHADVVLPPGPFLSPVFADPSQGAFLEETAQRLPLRGMSTRVQSRAGGKQP